ncbi:hypothetical protein [Streptomyces sp. 142MFCol3.1]|uniref:hypothetical protein n=1 Tax=Streptomyces sp. 142MFCol3.1 TaxID=1172179 RepID=UPI00041627F2|nr:hypothetical protein [Streptomyces sp. 142MFCol3.1]
MLRGRTARTLFTALAAMLILLQVVGPAETFASAHRGETVACAGTEHPHKAAPAPGARRHARDEDLVPEPPSHPLSVDGPAATRSPAPGAASHPRTPRSPAAHSPEGLQVFRC